METTTNLRSEIDQALNEIERTADEVRLKLHLAEMDARTAWEKQLEPKLLEARDQARIASAATKAAIDDTLAAIRAFSKAI